MGRQFGCRFIAETVIIAALVLIGTTLAPPSLPPQAAGLAELRSPAAAPPASAARAAAAEPPRAFLAATAAADAAASASAALLVGAAAIALPPQAVGLAELRSTAAASPATASRSAAAEPPPEPRTATATAAANAVTLPSPASLVGAVAIAAAMAVPPAGTTVPDAAGNCCVESQSGERACVRAGTRMAFRDNVLCERGTSVSLFDYMDAFERLLCGVAWASAQDSDTLCPLYKGVSSAPRFRERFGGRVFVTDRWWSTVDADLRREGIGTLYQIMAGDVGATGTLPTCARNVVHAVFDASQPHGDGYAAISPVLPTQAGAQVPVVLHIVRPALAGAGNLRATLGIADGERVFCRHGGFTTFSIDFARAALCEFVAVAVAAKSAASARPWLLFMGTDPLACVAEATAYGESGRSRECCKNSTCS